MADAISRTGDVPDLLARVLAARGICPETLSDHLAPTLRALLPDPSVFRDMDTAASRLAEAVSRRERIALFGDYDVDGGASVAMLLDWLAQLGLSATTYVPHRIEEGYGPNVPAMRTLARAHDLIVCLDCGTASPNAIAAARSDADVLVVDHHLPSDTLPAANAIVNPNRPDCPSGQGHLAAAGVAFVLLVATNRTLRAGGAFATRREPDLLSLLDLVALATVADVAPLVGLNRAFVRQGLTVMARRDRPGLAALGDVAGLRAPPTARDLGFALGPRINAGGRIGEADLGQRLLASVSAEEARALAVRLDALNRERRAIEADVLAEAERQIEARGAEGPLVWAAGEGWHPGVVGIVASRLKDRYNRPALVIGLAGGEGKGSGRSVPGVDLGAPVSALAASGHLLKGGGHRMAAGLSVAEDKLEEAIAALASALDRQGAGRAGPRDLRVDGALAPAAATRELAEALEAAGPFGQANPAPRIVFPSVAVSGLRTVGERHLACRLKGRTGGGLEAILFGAEETGLGPALRGAAESGIAIHVAGRLERDDWGGRRRAKLTIEDVART